MWSHQRPHAIVNETQIYQWRRGGTQIWGGLLRGWEWVVWHSHSPASSLPADCSPISSTHMRPGQERVKAGPAHMSRRTESLLPASSSVELQDTCLHVNLKSSDSGPVCTVQFKFSCWSLPSRGLVLAQHTAEGFLDGRNVSCPGYRSLGLYPVLFWHPRVSMVMRWQQFSLFFFPCCCDKMSSSIISVDTVCVTWSWRYNQFTMAGKFRQQVLPEAVSHINSTVRKQRAMNTSFLSARFLHLCWPKNGPRHNGYIFCCQVHIMKIIPHRHAQRPISHVILDPIKLAGSHNLSQTKSLL